MSWARWVVRLVLAAALAVAFGYVPYEMYGPGGLGRSLQLEGELQTLVRKNEALRRKNSILRKKIESLRHDKRVIERVARDELGMVRAEDVVFQIR